MTTYNSELGQLKIYQYLFNTGALDGAVKIPEISLAYEEELVWSHTDIKSACWHSMNSRNKFLNYEAWGKRSNQQAEHSWQQPSHYREAAQGICFNLWFVFTMGYENSPRTIVNWIR